MDNTEKPNRLNDDLIAREIEVLIAYDDDGLHTEPMDDLTRRRFVDDLVARLEETERKQDNRAFGQARIRFLRAATAVVAIVTAACLAFFLFVWDTGETIDTPDVRLIPTKVTHARVLDISGDSRAGLTEGDAVAAGKTVVVDDGHTVLALDEGVLVLLENQARFRVSAFTSDRLEGTLDAGSLFAAVSPERNGPNLLVKTEKGVVRVTGTIFAVSHEDESVRVEVFRGTVRVDDATGEREIAASQSVVMGQEGIEMIDSTRVETARWKAHSLRLLAEDGDTVLADLSEPPAPTDVSSPRSEGHADSEPRKIVSGKIADCLSEHPASKIIKPRSARELLSGAQQLRAKKDWKGASAAYLKLIEAYPDSNQARASLVSLGSIQLDHLSKTAQALSNFERYLKGGAEGVLTVEAAWGRARCFRRLGRTADEKRALSQFLSQHPGAFQVQEAQARLAELE